MVAPPSTPMTGSFIQRHRTATTCFLPPTMAGSWIVVAGSVKLCDFVVMPWDVLLWFCLILVVCIRVVGFEDGGFCLQWSCGCFVF